MSVDVPNQMYNWNEDDYDYDDVEDYDLGVNDDGNLPSWRWHIYFFVNSSIMHSLTTKLFYIITKKNLFTICFVYLKTKCQVCRWNGG